MNFDDGDLFEQAYETLTPHLLHKLTITAYGGDAAPDNLAVECEECNQTLIDFSPEPSAEVPPSPELSGPFILYPEHLFTELRLYLVLMRFAVMDGDSNEDPVPRGRLRGDGHLMPRDMSDIMSQMLALDAQLIEAQKQRGYSDTETLAAIRERVVRKTKDRNNGE